MELDERKRRVLSIIADLYTKKYAKIVIKMDE